MFACFCQTFRLTIEVQLSAKWLLAFGGSNRDRLTCGKDVVGVAVVGKAILEDAYQTAFEGSVVNGYHELDAAIKIA